MSLSLRQIGSRVMNISGSAELSPHEPAVRLAGACAPLFLGGGRALARSPFLSEEIKRQRQLPSNQRVPPRPAEPAKRGLVRRAIFTKR